MEARDLQGARQPQVPDRAIGLRQEEVKVDEVGHCLRMDQQCGLDRFRLRLVQQFKLVPQFREQFRGRCRRGDRVTNLPLDVNRLGEWTQVEPDHRSLQPELRRTDNLGGARRAPPCR